MKPRTQGTSLSAIALIALSASTVAACGRIPGQFEIVHNQAPQAGCSLVGDESAPYRGSGMLDLSLVKADAEAAFFVYPLLKNNMDAPSGGIDTNQIALESFAVDVSLRDPSAGPAATAAVLNDPANARDVHRNTPWSGKVSSGGGVTPTAVVGISVALAQKLLAAGDVGAAPSSLTLNVRVRAFGHTTVSNIESDPFNYPVSVCAGCLVANLMACPYTTPTEHSGDPCNVAQDIPVDCCSNGGELTCPPVVSQ